jgi:3-hydroxyisobutyrate dehydrogenase
MGYRMAVNLMHAGHSLVVYDSSAAALDRMQKAGDLPTMSFFFVHPRCQRFASTAAHVTGAEVGASPQNIGETDGVKVIVTMLPSSQHVRSVYCGQDGILQAQGECQL